MVKERICEICGKKYTPTSNRQKYCLNCKKIRYKEVKKECDKLWREKNQERIKKNKTEYYQKNKEKEKARSRQWYQDNIEYYKEYDKKRRKTQKYKEYDKERKQTSEYKQYIKQYMKKYRKQNKEKINKQKSEWAKNNRDKININKKQKYQENLNLRLINSCRNMLRRCLKSQKDQHTFDILNYTPEQLKQRLEIQFEPHQNWENYGTVWEIDHHKELYKFNFVKEDGTPDYHQIFLANCLANLRPLDINENRSRSSKKK